VRRRTVIAVLAVAGGLLVGGTVALLLAPGKSDPKVPVFADAPAPRSWPHVNGLVVSATGTKFVLREPGGTVRKLAVRTADRPWLDVQHAQSHAAVGQPVNVYYCRYDGKVVAIYLEDAVPAKTPQPWHVRACRDNGKVFRSPTRQPPATAATTASTTTTTP
jgi:hypothetical protein